MIFLLLSSLRIAAQRNSGFLRPFLSCSMFEAEFGIIFVGLVHTQSTLVSFLPYSLIRPPYHIKNSANPLHISQLEHNVMN